MSAPHIGTLTLRVSVLSCLLLSTMALAADGAKSPQGPNDAIGVLDTMQSVRGGKAYAFFCLPHFLQPLYCQTREGLGMLSANAIGTRVICGLGVVWL